MKIIAINGSPKKNGNTSIVLQTMTEDRYQGYNY